MKMPFLSSRIALVGGVAVAMLWACSSNDSPADQVPPPDGGLDAGDAGIDAAQDAPSDVSKPELTIVSYAPKSYDSYYGAAVGASIHVTFSESITYKTAPISLALRDGSVVPSTVKQSEDGRTLIVTPTTPIVPPAEVVATFGDISTVDGRGLASKPRWEWKVPRWWPMGRVEADNLAEPTVAIGPGAKINVTDTDWTSAQGPRALVWSLENPLAEWTQVGEPLPPRRRVHRPLLQIDPNGAPVVATIEDLDSYDYRVCVRRWSGSQWTDIGVPFGDTSLPHENEYSMVIDAAGKIYVAFEESVPADESKSNAGVWTFDGRSWNRLGPLLNDRASEGDGRFPLVALDKAGTPYVTFSTGLPWRDANTKSYVKKWTGSAWVRVGNDFTPASETARFSRIAFDSAGELFAFAEIKDAKNESTARILRFDGTKWLQVGAPVGKFTNSPDLYFTAGRDGHVFGLWEARVSDKDTLHLVDATRDNLRVENTQLAEFAQGLAVDPDGYPLIVGRSVFRLNR